MKKPLIALSTVLLLAAGGSAQEAGAKNETAVKPANDCANLPSLEKRLEEMDRHLKDWPELSRYQGANSKLAPPAKEEERVVFMGDSITDSWSNPQFGGFFPGKPYVNRGISGQTTQLLCCDGAETVFDFSHWHGRCCPRRFACRRRRHAYR